jgi:hypothetical protein
MTSAADPHHDALPRDAPRGGPAPLERFGRWVEPLAVALTLAGLVAAIVLACLTEGFYHDDDIGHYIFARDAWYDATARWHSWARPGYNLPTMFAAHFFGMFGCRVFSAFQTAGIAYLAYRIARRLLPGGGWTVALTPALVWVQPLVMTAAFTTLTETTAGLYLTLAVWLVLRGNRVWGCLAAGLSFITRYELAALAPIFAAVVIRDALVASQWKAGRALRSWRPWACAGAMLAPPVAYMAIVHLSGFPPNISPVQFMRNDVEEYGRGPWRHHLVNLVILSGWGVLTLASVSATTLIRRTWLPAALSAGLVLLHTVIFHFGLVASGGYERFLIPVCGLVAALAGTGLGLVWRSEHRRHAAAAMAFLAFWVMLMARTIVDLMSRRDASVIAAASVVGAMLSAFALNRAFRLWLGRAAAAAALSAAGWQAYMQVPPAVHERDPHRLLVAQAVEELSRTEHAGRKAITGHVLAGFLRQNTHVVYSVPDAIRKWRAAEPGTLYVWDNKYGGRPGLRWEDLGPANAAMLCPPRPGAAPFGLVAAGLSVFDPVSPLYSSLVAGGKPVWQRSIQAATVEVFVRTPIPPGAP